MAFDCIHSIESPFYLCYLSSIAEYENFDFFRLILNLFALGILLNLGALTLY